MSYKITVDVLAQDYAKPVGCRISGGRLLPALSPVFTAGTIPPKVNLVACLLKDHSYYLACDGTNLYYSSSGTSFSNHCAFSGDFPFIVRDIVSGTERTTIIAGKKGVSYLNRKTTLFDTGEYMLSGFIHCGRLIGSGNGTKVCWSGVGGITDWTEGINGSGSLYLDGTRGSILNLVEYGDKIVAVRKLGLTVLSMYGAPENFAVEFTDTDSDEIIRNTAKVVGGKLIFCTVSGLKSFNGSVIKKENHRCESDICDPVCAEGFGGKYFLSCKSVSLDRKVVLCYDPDDGESYLIDIDSDVMCTAKVLRFYDGSGAYTLATGGDYSFTSGNINFGSGRYKTVTSMFVDSDGADIEISNGKTARRFLQASGHIRPNLRGKNFTVKVSGKNPVHKLTATAEECNAI